MNNLDRLKEKLLRRERVFGYTAYIPTVYTLRDYLPESVDYILFDCEHGPNDPDQWSDCLSLCRTLDIPAIVRVPDALYQPAARAIDCGADGILVPRVESVKQVEAVIGGLRMPPLGKKGFGGKFLFYPGETVEQFNARRLLWIQIESRKGLEALPEILDRYGTEISACVIGPGDLAVNSGVCQSCRNEEIGRTLCDTTRDIITRTYKICENRSISSGSYCFDEEDAKTRIALGTNLIWMGSDAFYMLRGIREAAKAIANISCSDKPNEEPGKPGCK